MKNYQIVLSILKPRLEDYKNQLKDHTDIAPENYRKFFELHACDAYKLSYKIECLSVFFEKDKLNDIEVREYLQSGIDFFTKSLLERPLQAGTSNTMHNLSYILKLEAQQELLRLYKQMMGKLLSGETEKPFKISYVLGTEAVREYAEAVDSGKKWSVSSLCDCGTVVHGAFATQEELDAYKQGIEDATGYLESERMMTDKEWKEYLNVVEALMDSIKESLSKGEEVYFRGFGSFIIKHRAEKTARDISKNTTIIVPAHNIPAFRPSKEFTEMLQGR